MHTRYCAPAAAPGWIDWAVGARVSQEAIAPAGRSRIASGRVPADNSCVHSLARRSSLPMDDATSPHGLPSDELLGQAAAGDLASLGALLEQYRSRLRRMVRLRLDPRLQGRVDTSDVIQEAFLDAARRLPDYVREPKAPFFLWLRFLTGQKLLELRRRHLGAELRDAGREVSLYRGIDAGGQLGLPGRPAPG